MYRNWSKPLALGICIAVIAGCLNCADVLARQNYLSYHLYYSAARIFVSSVDRYALFAISGSYLIWALYALVIGKRRQNTDGSISESSLTRSRLDRLAYICQFVSIPLIGCFLSANILYAFLWAGNNISAKSKPNIVLIVLDATRADHLSCYGYSRATTPHIDSLAEQGIMFKHAVAQSSWTRPSICSFVTSRYPETLNLGVPHPPSKLSDYYVTMAEILKDNGYSTSAVVSNTNLDSLVNFNQGYDSFDDSNKEKDITSRSVTSLGIEQIRRLRDKRFFLTLHYMDPHFPYAMHKEFNYAPNYRGKLSSTISNFQDFGKSDLEYVKACYDSEISFTDEYIGRVIAALKAQGLFDNTMIIVMADHGDEFHEHGGYNHGHSLYQELLNVPCIVKLPGTQKGRVVDGTFAMIDLLPSVLKFIDCYKPSYRMYGSAVDLNRLNRHDDKYVFSATDVAGPNFKPASIRSVQSGNYKFIRYLDRSTEMVFDLLKDPGEQHDLVAKNPEVFQKLKRVCTEHTRLMDSIRQSVPPQEQVERLNNNELRLLRSLGYLQ